MAVQREGKLIICPTPLGNLGDMTQRTLDVLARADVVCCEDTRVTGKLLRAFDISRPLERLDEAKISTSAQHIVERVLAGQVIAYCSDAGMPGVSDPGLRLIDAAYEQGASVEVLPGASAVTLAYVASGFSSPSFYFGGFFPRKAAEQLRCLENLKNLDAALIFYESPRRIVAALERVAHVYPYRQVAVCRELTKVHEEVLRGPIRDVYKKLKDRELAGGIKGEIAFVIDAPNEEEAQQTHQSTLQDAQALLEQMRNEGTLTKKDMVKQLQQRYGLSRNDAYELVHSSGQKA